MTSAAHRRKFHRRKFLAASAVTLAAPGFLSARNANDKLNLAIIGVGNRGAANLAGVAHENIVALCDVDPNNAPKARDQFPQASFFTDYRQLFDKVANSCDAVVISTPDHSHSLPACIAMSLKKHVYCEKPLAETVSEVRHMQKLAAKYRVVTQMGTQIHAGENYRRVVEIIQSKLLGEIRQVYVWNSSKPVGGRKVNRKPSAKFDLDLWMGPIAGEFFEAEMNKSSWNFPWPHFHWRWWWEWGGGTLADLGCHYMDLPFWALGLTAPQTIRASGQKTYSGDNTTPDVMRVDYHFPRTSQHNAIDLVWEHGVAGPDGGQRTFKGYGAGVLFVGTQGELVADYNKHQLLPEKFAKDFRAPAKSLAPSLGHYKEWTEACKGRGTPLCHFEYAGRLTEAVLLGNVAYRAGQEITWNAEKMTTGRAPADQYLQPQHRRGWELPS